MAYIFVNLMMHDTLNNRKFFVEATGMHLILSYREWSLIISTNWFGNIIIGLVCLIWGLYLMANAVRYVDLWAVQTSADVSEEMMPPVKQTRDPLEPFEDENI